MTFNPTATFWSGNPLMLDYTPVAFTGAGTCIKVGAGVYILHVDIQANQLGAYSAGPGLYSVLAAAGTYTDGENAYWDDTAKLVTAQVSGNTKVGTFSGAQTVAAAGKALVNWDLQFHGT